LRYPDALAARPRDADDDCEGSADQHLHYCQDANWNVTALVDAADGVVVERYLYDPYGRPTVLNGTKDAAAGTTTDWSGPRNANNTFSNEILFCSYRYDPATGLYHVRNRDEHPTLGRWIQTDPAGYTDGANLYEYCLGSPLGWTDPSGLEASDDDRLQLWSALAVGTADGLFDPRGMLVSLAVGGSVGLLGDCAIVQLAGRGLMAYGTAQNIEAALAMLRAACGR
jgi:RHS repeat-associated protein